MTRVLVFGTFDGLHPGHVAMLNEAKDHGDELVAVVAKDDVVARLKGKRPRQSFDERSRRLQESGLVDGVVCGDSREGEYAVLREVEPDIVAFGYDQEALRENLLNYLEKTGKKMTVVTLSPFEPETYKSSKMNPL